LVVCGFKFGFVRPWNGTKRDGVARKGVIESSHGKVLFS
jgi:hypothetical protein